MIFKIQGEIKKRTFPALRRMVQKLKTMEVFFDNQDQHEPFPSFLSRRGKSVG
jgi:hypothetical protein